MASVLHLSLFAALGFLDPTLLRLADDGQVSFDRTVAGVPALDRQGSALVRYVAGLGLTEQEHERTLRLVAELGSERFRIRERATRELMAALPAAIVLLKQSLRDGDQERQRRLEMCLAVLRSRHNPAQT